MTMSERGRPGTLARFWSKVDRSGDCWLWRAGSSRSGYGVFSFGSAQSRAHRVAYELIVGPVPAGLTLDHLCRNRLCVNPAHLEPVTHRVNVLRGIGHGATNAAKTECIQGHAFTAQNTRVRPNGSRACRTCDRHRHRANRIRPLESAVSRADNGTGLFV